MTWQDSWKRTKAGRQAMMTSSNGNIFRVTGHLCGEFTGHRWIPRTEPVTRRFDVLFDLRLNKQLSKQSWGWWSEMPSRPLWRHINASLWTIYCQPSFFKSLPIKTEKHVGLDTTLNITNANSGPSFMRTPFHFAICRKAASVCLYLWLARSHAGDSGNLKKNEYLKSILVMWQTEPIMFVKNQVCMWYFSLQWYVVLSILWFKGKSNYYTNSAAK